MGLAGVPKNVLPGAFDFVVCETAQAEQQAVRRAGGVPAGVRPDFSWPSEIACRSRGQRRDMSGSNCVVTNTVDLMPYRSMTSRQVGSHSVVSSME
jgi:hypothetical protein